MLSRSVGRNPVAQTSSPPSGSWSSTRSPAAVIGASCHVRAPSASRLARADGARTSSDVQVRLISGHCTDRPAGSVETDNARREV